MDQTHLGEENQGATGRLIVKTEHSLVA